MKRLLFLLFSIFSVPLFAQNINGLVRDLNTQVPIASAQIITENRTILTDNEGRFRIMKVKIGQKISFRIMGYETLEMSIREEMFSEGLVVQLQANTIDLSAVTIRAKRNYKLDSLTLRKEFAKEFNYKGIAINDMFVTVNPEYKPPLALQKPNSTSAIASLNLLQVFSLFGKGKVQNTKLKETLLADEEARYVDHMFSRSKIESITPLKEDSLQTFMQRYRPSANALKKMSDYELIIYIKKSYNDYKNSRD